MIYETFYIYLKWSTNIRKKIPAIDDTPDHKVININIYV